MIEITMEQEYGIYLEEVCRLKIKQNAEFATNQG